MLNLEDAKGTKPTFTMGLKTFDLDKMQVSIDGNTYPLKKSERNIRKRPDDNSKGGTDGLLGSDEQNYKALGWEF